MTDTLPYPPSWFHWDGTLMTERELQEFLNRHFNSLPPQKPIDFGEFDVFGEFDEFDEPDESGEYDSYEPGAFCTGNSDSAQLTCEELSVLRELEASGFNLDELF